MHPAAPDLIITSTFCVYLLAMVAIGVIAYRRTCPITFWQAAGSGHWSPR